MDIELFAGRWAAAKNRLREAKADGVVICGGSDLVYLTGYNASSYERLTAFVARVDEERLPAIVVPKIEEPLVPVAPALFETAPWIDDDDPIAMIAESLAGASLVLVSDELWSIFLLGLQRLMPETTFVCFSDSLGGLRSVKSEHEMQALQTVGGLADQVAAELQNGQIALIGRTEKQIAADISNRLLELGNDTVEFCIVATGPNSASPHHHPTDRVVQAGEMVLCDFGGKHQGYCSDVTRCVWTGPIPDDVAATYDTLKKAQQAAVDAARPGASLADVDAAARDVIADAGFGDRFIHRTGHGIGTEVHEQPYVKPGNDETIVAGHAFSIEPGIYIPGQWGMRLEDIVVVIDQGAIRCTSTDHNLVAVDA